MNRTKLLFATATLLLGALITAAATAGDKSVEEILAIIDGNLTKVEDQTYTAEMEVVRDGKSIKTLKFEAQLKGLTMKLIKFTAPGDVRDMSILTTADGNMYVYMPSYKRVRRVAAHVRNQGFMGSDISPAELAAASLSEGWSGVIEREDEKVWVLDLKPKAGNDTEYSHMRVTVSKEHQGVEKIESYNSEGKLTKSQVRTDWNKFGVIEIPTVFTYTDHQTGSKTILRFRGCEVNKGIPDSAFTKRALMRGN